MEALLRKVMEDHRGAEGLHRLIVGHVAPVGPELPGAQAHYGYCPAGPAQVGITGAGNTDEFRTLAAATQTQPPLPAQRSKGHS